MLIIYPAIDIKEGRCVRLIQGKFNAESESVYSKNPVEIALNWEYAGSKYLHVVDLDGAKTGNMQNLSIIIEIVEKLCIPIQIGGGVRSIDMIDYLLSHGIERVILGTSAVCNHELVKNAIKKYINRIVIGIDARDGLVAIDGWRKISEFKAVEFGKMMEDMGASSLIYTDISRDGMLSGPNLKAMEQMARAVKIDVIASGGVSSLMDIRNLKVTGVFGVIVGKAIYTGNVKLEEAIKVAEE